ncbi:MULTISPECIES: PIN domain-containing protein [unclassified Isoptericola]|uniref:PIN domain-containing protein n=1 Tax=unclassified Isoptericola TaxID=2623355 RepID=UPI003655C6DA
MSFPVVLDACVLVPHPLFDTLLRLADTGMFRPLWTLQILDEVERTLIDKRGLAPAKARHRIRQMSRAFPEALIEGYEDLIPAMTNDPKDRHVLAAAVRSGASVIVTANLKDFPIASMERYEIEAVHPDAFLLDQLDLDAKAVLECLREQHSDYTDPSLSVAEFFQAFRPTVPKFAEVAESLTQGSRADTSAGRWPAWPRELPLPLEARTAAEAFAAFFPEGEPSPSVPLGAAFLWWKALLDIDRYRMALDSLTLHPPAWDDFRQARADLDGWSMAQRVDQNDEHPELVAHVRFIPPTASSAQVFADAVLPEAHVLTLVRCDDGWWRAWGLSRNRYPSYAEVIGSNA